MKTTRHLIDWEAYKQGLRQLGTDGKAEEPAADPATTANSPREPTPPAPDPGAELLARQASEARQQAQAWAWGSVGRHLGNLQGEGLAPTHAEPEPQPPMAANRHLAELQRLLGERLHQNYQQRLKMDGDAQRRADQRQLQLDLNRQASGQAMQRQQQRQLFQAATQTLVSDPKAEAAAEARAASAKAAKRQGGSGNRRKVEMPYSIADTDGKQVFGHWNLTADEAAQVLQTAVDLGDQAQLDYVAHLAGADGNADRKATTARLLSLQQKALMGNADARQRMVRLLSAILPSLKGKRVIDGILEQRYVNR